MSRNPANKWTFILDEDTRILFVDDDLILAEFAKVHLSTPTTTVESAADGLEAYERLCNEPFDIVLLDIEMPKLDGFALLERLRAEPRFAQLPIVMLTGREDIASIDRAFQLGASSFITKPLNWRQLSYALRYVLRTKRMEADLIKERKRSEELLQLTNNLLSLLRLESRTPLSAIIGFSDCIRKEIDGPIGVSSYLKYAEQIDSAAHQLQDNFLDLIQYAQFSAGSARLQEDEYPAAKVLDAAVAGLSTDAARQQVALDVERPDDSFYILCDLQWLARALRHLLEVAISDPGAGQASFGIGLTQKGGAKLTIVARKHEDAGAQETQAATSPESVRHGMGVGVAFARCVVDLHEGELFVAKREDGSTEMSIVLPPKRVLQSSPKLTRTEAA